MSSKGGLFHLFHVPVVVSKRKWTPEKTYNSGLSYMSKIIIRIQLARAPSLPLTLKPPAHVISPCRY